MKQPSKEIWISPQDLTNDPVLIEASKREFPQSSVMDELSENDNMGRLESTRRDFLKFLGFSLGAATIAASCEIPVKKAIPYVVKPDAIVPGVASYYASAFVDGGDLVPVLVKTRDGRPIKVEGNPLSPMTGGGTSARSQASVLSLYDTYRLQKPGMVDGGKVTYSSWDKVDAEILKGLKAASAIRIVSRTVNSPSAKSAIATFQAAYPGTEWIQYDPVSSSALLDANEKCYGLRAIPSYQFDKADLIVSFGADFLGTWISPVEYARAYASNRKIKDAAAPVMSRHYQIESYMSLTGSNADHRILIKPSEQAAAIAALYNVVAQAKGGPNVGGPALNTKAKQAIEKIGGELLSADGKSLIVSDINDLSSQILIARINELLSNIDNTLSFKNYSNQKQGSDKAMASLVQDMKAGRVGALLILDGNPAFEASLGADFAQGMEKVKLKVACGLTLDETGALCNFITPTNHTLESWGDAEPKSGEYYFVQPTIAPLFKGRQWEESLLRWAESVDLNLESDSPYLEYVSNYWKNNLFARQQKFLTFQSFWDSALHDGLFVTEGQGQVSGSALAAEVGSLPAPLSGQEVICFETVNMGAGQFAGNPWLQEMPDPVSRCVWGNYLYVPIGWDGGNDYTWFKGMKDGDKLNITVGGVEREVTVVHQFGLAVDSFAIALGYGRQTVGAAGKDVGTDVQSWIKPNRDGYTQYAMSIENISEAVGRDKEFACVQHHHTLGVTGQDASGETINVDEKTVATIGEGYQGSLVDRSIIFRGQLSEIKELEHKIEHKRKEYQFLNDKTLYPGYDEVYQMGHHWGMHIDLSACTGCGACTVACMAENNVPVVGKKEVFRHHEMTWLRIDRYYYGDLENPSVVYQPMMCQHCDNAPCENVCPVSATNHSSEGLNQMAYNRCIGTRYCANNCPYKVRRFNWLDYTAADLFPANEPYINGEEIPFGADNLTRMVLNPDVTVRSRGVMEKCSFCVQRIQEGKLTAKKEGRALRDGDVKSACMTACPTGAITFGDFNNKESLLNQQLESPLVYQVLEEVNTRPSVNYRARVLNKNTALES